MAEKSVKPLELFYSYAHKDEALRNELENHLSLLKRQGYITNWHNRKVMPGNEWAREIDAHLASAHIILLLVSPDFMASDYCYDIEVQQALEKHTAGEVCVIPVIIRPVDWEEAPFGKLQALPTNKRPVVSWHGRSGRDRAFQEIAKGIRDVVKQGITVTKSSAQSDILQKTKKQWLDKWNAAGILHEGFHLSLEAARLQVIRVLSISNRSGTIDEGSKSKFDKLNEEAKEILLFAQQEAPRYGHNYIGTEHFLLRFTYQTEGNATLILSALGVDPDMLRHTAEKSIIRGHQIRGSNMDFTPQAIKTVQSAFDEAASLGNEYVGTEHLLMGILRDFEAIATTTLSGLGITLRDVRNMATKMFK